MAAPFPSPATPEGWVVYVQWRGIAMRSDKTARAYRAAIALSATLIWIQTDLIRTA